MLHAFRGLFVLVCAILGSQIGVVVYKIPWFEGALFGAGVGLAFGLLEWVYARRFVGVISVVMFGIVVGAIVAFFVIGALDLIPALRPDDARDPTARVYRDFGIMFVMCFMFVLAILHAKDDFKFVIPFVELKREGKSLRPLIVDTSAIIDGRFADVIEAGFVDAPIIVPKFVLDELQQVADSGDKLKRNRGRRGLEVLNRMRQSKKAAIQVEDVLLPEVTGVDAKLVKLATLISGRLVTTDFNLNKVAQVQGIEVLNVNDLANAVKPIVLHGEKMTAKITRKGEGAGQGVAYLDDGTMIVAEECADRIGQEVELTVTNILQTERGRLIFARPSASAEQAPARR
jgi:uncharacterized protein YacL